MKEIKGDLSKRELYDIFILDVSILSKYQFSINLSKNSIKIQIKVPASFFAYIHRKWVAGSSQMLLIVW